VPDWPPASRPAGNAPVVERVIKISRTMRPGRGSLREPSAWTLPARRWCFKCQQRRSGHPGPNYQPDRRGLTDRLRADRSLIVAGMSCRRSAPRPRARVRRLACCRHSLATAILAEQIATRHRQVPTDVSFIAGLLHDIGLIVLDEFFATTSNGPSTGDPGSDSPDRGGEGAAPDDTRGAGDAGREGLETCRRDHRRDEVSQRLHAARLEPAHEALCHTVYVANMIAKARYWVRRGRSVHHEIVDDVWDQIDMSSAPDAGFWNQFEQQFKECHSFLSLPTTMVTCSRAIASWRSCASASRRA